MKFIDGLLQRWRFRKALPFIPDHVRLVDAGAHKGELFELIGSGLREGFGVEPLFSEGRTGQGYRIVPGLFPEVRPTTNNWDAIALLAVLEHIPPGRYAELAEGCHALLHHEGRVIITVPSPRVDLILSVLRFLRLIDGMSLEQHHGFNPSLTEEIFAAPRFKLVHKEKFQCGLNYLFVFQKQANSEVNT